MIHSLKKLILTLASLLLSSNLHAAIMSFDNLTNTGGVSNVYVEDGITASGTPSVHTNLGTAHLDDFGSPLSSQINFSMDDLFTAISFNVININTGLFTDLGIAEGFRDGELVATTNFSSVSMVNLPATFTGLDTFRIIVTDHSELFDITGCGPCNHFDIDNITLTSMSLPVAPVPLPAGFPLMASALIGLGLFRHKKHDN